MICRARREYSLINGPSPFCQPPQRREGFYKDYEVEVKEQDVDDAKSTFKSAKATAKGKNKYVGVLGTVAADSNRKYERQYCHEHLSTPRQRAAHCAHGVA